MSQEKIQHLIKTDKQGTAEKGQVQRAVTANSTMVIAVTAVWFAILTGIAETILLSLAILFFNRFVFYFGPEMVWMAPLADIAIFAVPAMALILLAKWKPRLGSLPVAVALFSFLSVLDLLLLFTILHPIAVLVLSLGLGIQCGRLVASHQKAIYSFFQSASKRLRFRKNKSNSVQPPASGESGDLSTALSRRQFMAAAAMTVAGLTLGVKVSETVAEKAALSRLPIAPKPMPNVLLITMDTVRALNTSLYGYTRRTTPELERFARTGIVFDGAVSSASWTLPSHSSMFTGHYPHDLSVNYTAALDTRQATLAEFLTGQGYETAGFVGNLWYCSRASGLARGFTHYEDFTFEPERVLTDSAIAREAAGSLDIRRAIGYYEELGRKSAPEMNAEFLGWLSQRDDRRPFFAFINYFDAHSPYLPPAPFDTMYGPKEPRPNSRHGGDWNWTPAQLRAEMNAYDGAITFLDQELGRLFDELKSRGVLDNTLVIVASDHGDEFNEHGLVDHGFSLYWPVVHTVLMMSFPARLPSGVHIRPIATLRDLPATILDIIGTNGPSPFPGTSLSRHWQSPASTEIVLSEISFIPGYPKYYPISRGDVKALYLDQYHYIRNGDGVEELYNPFADPFEHSNLVKTPEGEQLVAKFRTSLEGIS